MPLRQLLLVVVVVGVAAGPLDPDSGLTGTLHYRRSMGQLLRIGLCVCLCMLSMRVKLLDRPGE